MDAAQWHCHIANSGVWRIQIQARGRSPQPALTLKGMEVKGRAAMVLALDQEPGGAASAATGPCAWVMPKRSVGGVSTPTTMNR